MEVNTLIKRIVNGESQLFSLLVDLYGKRVFALIFRMVKDKSEAEDILQETFIAAYENLNKFRMSSLFSTWLYRIAYNICLKKLKKKQVDFIQINEMLIDNIRDNDVDDFFKNEDDERCRLLNQAMDLLKPIERTILHLYYYDELSISQIASILEISETSVSTKLYRIRKKLFHIINILNDEYRGNIQK